MGALDTKPNLAGKRTGVIPRKSRALPTRAAADTPAVSIGPRTQSNRRLGCVGIGIAAMPLVAVAVSPDGTDALIATRDGCVRRVRLAVPE